MPTEADEIWRYSRISDLDLDAFEPTVDHGTAPAGIPSEAQLAVAACGERSGLVVVRNGKVAYTDLDSTLAERGLVLGDAAGLADGDDLVGDVSGDPDLFTELNSAFLPGAATVVVPPGLAVEHPIVIFHWIDGDRSAVFSRTIVRAGADSDVTVVEYQASADVTALVDPLVEIDVDDAARTGYVNVQDLGPQVWQVGRQVSRVGRDATLQSAVVALGGDYARVRTDSRIDGKGGTSYLNAVYFADGDRMHDFRTLQDHAAPSSTSDLLFKGAVQDRGRSVYSGLIRVRKEAPGTNAFQTNRNLVLSEGAGAESVPNLEIETNDVRCSHASAVGPIDDDQRYYLESRGLPPDVAERLIVLGFFGDVLERLPVPSLAASLRSTIGARLGGPSS